MEGKLLVDFQSADLIVLACILQKDTGSAMAKHSGAQLDLTAFSSPEELMSLGLDRLKSALTALGLKCGGYEMTTAQSVCQSLTTIIMCVS